MKKKKKRCLGVYFPTDCLHMLLAFFFLFFFFPVTRQGSCWAFILNCFVFLTIYKRRKEKLKKNKIHLLNKVKLKLCF